MQSSVAEPTARVDGLFKQNSCHSCHSCQERICARLLHSSKGGFEMGYGSHEARFREGCGAPDRQMAEPLLLFRTPLGDIDCRPEMHVESI